MRPAYRTIRGGVNAYVKSALAVADSACHCGAEVRKDEPIYLAGVAFIEGPRPRKVDLSGAEWVCAGCIAEMQGVPA